MRYLLIILSVCLTAQAFARKPKSLSPEEEAKLVFKQFKECSAHKEKSELVKCVQDSVSSNIDIRMVEKMSFWLSTVSIKNNLQKCPEEKLFLFPKASAKEYKSVKCFDFKQSTQNKTGIIYFLEDSGYIKIDGIQFF